MGWLLRKAFWLSFFLFVVYIISALWSGGNVSRRVGDITGIESCYELADKADVIKTKVNKFLGRAEGKKSDMREKASGRERTKKALGD